MKTFEEALKRINAKAWSYDFEQKVEQLRKEALNDFETKKGLLPQATHIEDYPTGERLSR